MTEGDIITLPENIPAKIIRIVNDRVTVEYSHGGNVYHEVLIRKCKD